MSFPEGMPGHKDIQTTFSSVALVEPRIRIVQMSELITPEEGLALPYHQPVRDIIGRLGLLPQGGDIPISAIWVPHKNSAGRYFVEYETEKPNPMLPQKRDTYHVYTYVLPPHSNTSIHGHNAFEFYIIHAGKFYLTLNGEEGLLDRFAIVGPDVEHTGRSTNLPALITAITYNPLDIAKEELHEYRWTQEEWTQAKSAAFHKILDELEDAAA